MSIDERLRELGVTLPDVAKPRWAYVPAVRSGNLIFVSGQIATSDGGIMHVRRRLIAAARALAGKKPLERENPASFCVRSAAVVLAPGADWVAGAAPRIVVRPGQQLIRA